MKTIWALLTAGWGILAALAYLYEDSGANGYLIVALINLVLFKLERED